MNPATPPEKKAESGIEAEAPGNVDKIRDILFGSQMRDYDSRFTRFEERLLKETTDLRDEMKRRIATLESFVKGESVALSDQIRAEQGERGEADKNLERDIKETAKAWERRAGQLEEQASKSQRDVREKMMEEAKRLAEEIEQKHKDLCLQIEKQAADLRGSLTDRLALADLFTEVALRLRNEFKIPGK